MNIKKLRALRWVRRFNFHQCANYQSVAEHSFFVALLAYELGRVLCGAEFGLKAMYRALLHDAIEAVTGDVPYLIRQQGILHAVETMAWREIDVEISSFDLNIDLIVGLADAVDLKMYLEEERRCGNRGLVVIEAETMYRIEGLCGEVTGVMLKSRTRLMETLLADLIERIPSRAPIDKLTHEGE